MTAYNQNGYRERKLRGVCTNCARSLPVGWSIGKCSRCAETSRKGHRRYTQSLIEKRLCVNCCSPLTTEVTNKCSSCKQNAKSYAHKYNHKNRSHIIKMGNLWRRNNIERVAINRAKTNKKLKDSVFAAYGGYRCACCGETEEQFMSIDHINGGGAAHRKEIRRPNIYSWLCKHNFPEGFQVLCFNCNFAKGHFGMCPHKRKGIISNPALAAA